MKRVIFIIFAVIVGASGCKAVKETTNNHSFTRTDSVFFEKVLKDTVIQRLPDSATIQALIRCNKRGEAVLRKTIITPGLKIKPIFIMRHDTILFTAKIDSAKIFFAYYQKNRNRIIKENTQDKQTVKIVKYRTPTWVYYLLAGLLIYVCIVYLLPLAKKILI